MQQEQEPCQNKEHYPPMHMALKPGQSYVHRCPECGDTFKITQAKIAL